MSHGSRLGDPPPRSAHAAAVIAIAAASLAACSKRHPAPALGAEHAGASAADAVAATVAIPARYDLSKRVPFDRPANRIAYIPFQCFAQTRESTRGAGATPARNPCYVCHTASVVPNDTNDGDLQLRLSLPPLAKANPWTNLVDPPVRHAPRMTDESVLSYVREDNYLQGGTILPARALGAPPPAWDVNGNGRWDGYAPDAFFSFDASGFDHRPDGSPTGWRAFAYYPLPGAFLPANGSFDDVLIRLPDAFRTDATGKPDSAVYRANLAIVEALIRRVDVPIDAVDETALGADLDLDGRLAQASLVRFDGTRDGRDATRMQWVGKAGELQRAGSLPIAPGLYPVGTELFHTVRYLDVVDGVPTLARRMKEVRYAKKVRWESYAIARANATREAREEDESIDLVHDVHVQRELGVYNGRGWILSGFIEDAQGALRPQTSEELAACAGCHGGIGSTTDFTFALARKTSEGPAHGWFHWSQHDVRGLPEPKRADGQFEYTTYLSLAGAGDDTHDNAEIAARFFDERGALRASEVKKLHEDVATLLLPSPGRALDLDRAYKAIVDQQSFDKGRDVVLSARPRVHARVPVGEPTGVTSAASAVALSP